MKKLIPPLSLRLTPVLKYEIEKLAKENGLAVTSQIRMLLTRGLAIGKRPSKQRIKAK